MFLSQGSPDQWHGQTPHAEALKEVLPFQCLVSIIIIIIIIIIF